MVSKKAYAKFIHGKKKLKDVQTNVLMQIVSNNKNTHFGQQNNFNAIHSIEDFQAHVPLCDYEDYLPYISKIMKGEENILTQGKLNYLALTSGTSSASKYIPYNDQLKNAFSHAISIWIYDLLSNNKSLLWGKQFWIVSPVSKSAFTESKVPVGFEKDSNYLGFFERILIKQLMVVPDTLSQIQNTENYYHCICLLLLANKNIRLLSVWNPSMLIEMIHYIQSNYEVLIQDIAQGSISLPNKNRTDRKVTRSLLSKNIKRSRELADNAFCWNKIWPHLHLISCWTDGWASIYLNELKDIFPNITIQGKGLLATEGVMSIPVSKLEAPILTCNCHFYEFKCTETKAIYTADCVEEGKTYEIIVSTQGGLYRYNMYDIVKVTGFYNTIPLLHFIGKSNIVSDITGEKLNEQHVARIIDKILAEHCTENGLAFLKAQKEAGSAFYSLYIDSAILKKDKDSSTIAEKMEEGLCENYHYMHSRKMRQLQHCKLVIDSAVNLQKLMTTKKEQSSTKKDSRLIHQL